MGISTIIKRKSTPWGGLLKTAHFERTDRLSAISLFSLIDLVYRVSFTALSAGECCPDEFDIADHIPIAAGRGEVIGASFFGLGIDDFGNFGLPQQLAAGRAKMLFPVHPQRSCPNAFDMMYFH